MHNVSLFILLLISALPGAAVAADASSAAPASGARWGLSVAAGPGAMGQRHNSWRAAGQRHWNRRWWRSRYGHLTGYWDLGLTLWDASGESPGPSDRGNARVYALGLGPVLRWQFEPLAGTTIAPFLELGVGLAILSDASLRSGRRRSLALGSHWQFEDRGVAGIRFGHRGRFELAYQRMHHSNLNLASSNHGVDSHLLLLGYHF